MCNRRWITSAAVAAVLLGITVLAIARHGARPLELVSDYSVDGPGLNVDDQCFWVDPTDAAETLLFVTAKDSGLVEVYKAATGAFVTTIPGFVKPNNCAVDGDLLLTSDRMAHDVKVHHLPDLALLRTFGGDMIEAEGIDVLHTPLGQTLVYVTDSGDSSVHVYDLTTGGLVRRFVTPGWGLGIEPVLADDRYQRIFLSREEGNDAHGIGLFTPEGALVKEFAAHVFSRDTEGLAIYQCGDEGYLIAADQQTNKSQFEVFDRVTLAHIGTFTMQNGAGEYTSSTDGIDILQTPLPGFPNGMLAACDGCGSTLPDETDVISWDKIAEALDLDLCPNKVAPDCVTTPCHQRIAALADATISSVTPTTNFGGATDLQIDGTPVDQTLLRFFVPNLNGFDILDASVRLTVDTQSGAGSEVGGSLFAASGAWAENSVTWDTRPAPVGSAIDTIGPIASAEAVDFDVRTALQEGAANDFLLVTASGDRAIYRSREADNSPPALLLTLHASTPPQVAITAPANGTVIPEGASAVLTATATDAEDGDLGAQVQWKSNRDGTLGTGGSISASLSSGLHTITAEVTDGAGLHGSATISVDINSAVQVVITAPVPGTTVAGGTPLTLTGSATDPDDGADLSASIAWTSSRDGALGTGAALGNVVLSEGTHVLSATVSGAGGGAAQRSVTITAAPPIVAIVSPADGTAVVSGQPVVLTATAHDFKDGALGAIAWSSDLQGALGTGTTVTAANLKLGTHLITAKVVDSDALPGQASLQLRVAPATMSFTAIADAFVRAKSPTKNFGTAATLELDSSPLSQAYLRFAVAGLAGLQVEKAILQLTVSTAAGANGTNGGTVYAITDTGWAETAITYDTRPPIDGPALATRGAVAKSDVVELDVTSAVTGDGSITFALLPDSSDDVKYKSREPSSGRPKLILTVRSATAMDAPPTVTITAPTIGTAVTAGTPVTLSATAADYEDGDLSSTIEWTSDLAGDLGTGPSLTLSSLAAGTHTITAAVVDSASQPGSTTTTLIVTAAGTLTVAAAADTYVGSDAPAKNYGGATTMQADASPVRQIFMRFVVSGVAGRHVDTAILRLTTGSASSAASTKGGFVHAITDTGWTESGVTYDTRPTIDGPVLATVGAIGVAKTVDLDVSGAVHGDGTIVFALDTTSSDGVTYVTREGGAGAPQLLIATSVVATPQPTPTVVVTATTTPTAILTATATATRTATPVAATATAQPSSTPTPLATSTATVTSLPSATATPLRTATVTPLPTTTATITPLPTATATVTSLPAATATVTSLPIATATAMVTTLPTATATTTPIATPTVAATPTPVAINLTQLGAPIARVSVPTGGGSKTLATIRDGDKPPVNTNQPSRQYDTYDGANTATDEWLGYVYPESHTFERVVFQEGMAFWDGGWFETLTVQVRQGGVWTTVAGLTVTPAYPAINNNVAFETYTLRFPPVSGDGIRIDGRPGGVSDFVSVGELEVYGDAVAP